MLSTCRFKHVIVTSYRVAVLNFAIIQMRYGPPWPDQHYWEISVFKLVLHIVILYPIILRPALPIEKSSPARENSAAVHTRHVYDAVKFSYMYVTCNYHI